MPGDAAPSSQVAARHPFSTRSCMITGDLFIGFTRVRSHDQFFGIAAADGAPLSPAFSIAGAAEVARACALAEAAFDPFRRLSPADRAHFLDAIPDDILALGA